MPSNITIYTLCEDLCDNHFLVVYLFDLPFLKECNCDPTGSVSLQCDQETGQCPCLPGVGGRTCSECQEGFKGLSFEGCEPCGCDADGSLSDVCNPETGQCLCKVSSKLDYCFWCYTGWPRKNATLVISNFNNNIDKVSLLFILLGRKFFFK